MYAYQYGLIDVFDLIILFKHVWGLYLLNRRSASFDVWRSSSAFLIVSLFCLFCLLLYNWIITYVQKRKDNLLEKALILWVLVKFIVPEWYIQYIY